MRRALIWLMLCSFCRAQTQGNLPTMDESLTSDATQGGTGDDIIFRDVVTGDLLFVCNSRGFGNSLPALTIADTFTSTWHLSAALQGVDSDGNAYGLQAGWAIANGSGTDDISCTPSGGGARRCNGAKFHGAPTVDGSFATNSVAGFPNTVSVSSTTSVLGDLVISCMGGGNTGTTVIDNSGSQFGELDTNFTANLISFKNATATGSYTFTMANNPGYSGQKLNVMNAISLAFSPPLGIADTYLPDADKVQAYSATIHPVGGTGTYACTLQSGSLPTGLSLGGTGNCTISGTITGAVGNYPITIRVTESGGGTHADSSGLSIKVGATFGTPALIQHAIFATIGSGPFFYAFPSNATSGNLGVVLMSGFGRHSGEGYMMPITGAGATMTDTLGTVWTRGQPIAFGSRPIIPYVGCFTASGPDTITYTDNTSDGSPIGTALLEFSNTQKVLDIGVLKAQLGSSSSPYTVTTPSFNVPVTGDTLLSGTSTNFNGSATLVPSAPFTTIGTSSSTAGQFEVAYDVAASSGGTTATETITVASPADQINGMLLIGLRPEISGLPCGATPAPPATVSSIRVREY